MGECGSHTVKAQKTQIIQICQSFFQSLSDLGKADGANDFLQA